MSVHVVAFFSVNSWVKSSEQIDDIQIAEFRYTPPRRGAIPGTRYFMPTTSALPLNVGFHFNARLRVVNLLTTRYFDFHQTSTFDISGFRKARESTAISDNKVLKLARHRMFYASPCLLVAVIAGAIYIPTEAAPQLPAAVHEINNTGPIIVGRPNVSNFSSRVVFSACTAKMSLFSFVFFKHLNVPIHFKIFREFFD